VVALVFAVVIFVFVHMVVGGKRVFSADEGNYVAHNSAFLATIPVYPGSKRRPGSSSIGNQDPNGFAKVENGGPYDSYRTIYAFDGPRGATCDEVWRYYRFLHLDHGVGYSNGASIEMSCDTFKGAPVWTMMIDYQGDRRNG